MYTNTYVEAQTIKVKKAPKPEKGFLTVEEYRSMLECIDITNSVGMMHYLLISVLYDTAARVDGAVRMNHEDFSFGKENSARIIHDALKIAIQIKIIIVYEIQLLMS